MCSINAYYERRPWFSETGHHWPVDVAEFERLYAEHADSLFSFFAYRTGDRALADDLLADTFERVLRARRGFDARRGGERAWLYTIALNILRDHSRRRRTEVRAVNEFAVGPRESATSGGLLAVEARQSLAAAMAGLEPEEVELIALRYGADLTLREVAEVTGAPISTVESRLKRALRILREALG
jgi:RNA polymerase sigma-70 factor (ECF subfamily)